jgi:hypothetical protein
MGFHYSTTARTMLSACRHREQLGDDFNRLLGVAIRWAGLRKPLAFATDRIRCAGRNLARAQED